MKVNDSLKVMGVAVLASLSLPPGASAHAFNLPSRPVCSSAFDAARQDSPPLQASLPHACPPDRQENAKVANAQGTASADDDTKEMEGFQDLIVKESFKEVEPELQSYLATHPRSWKAYYFLGYVQFRQRKIGESIKSLSKSLEINPDSAEAHKMLGKNLTIIGRYDYALREYDAALRLDPGSAEVHYNFGKIYAIQDEWTKAREEFEKAVQLDMNYMEAYNALGFAMEAVGDTAEAERDYLAAIRINEQRRTKFDSPYINLSGYYNYRGKFDLALEYAHKALELNPQSDLAYFQIAKTCRARQDWTGVVGALEKAIAINSWRPQYFYVLGIAYGRLGKTEESKRALQTFQDLEKRNANFERQRRELHREKQGQELRPED